MPAPEISLLDDLRNKADVEQRATLLECVKARELLMHSLVAALQTTLEVGLDAVELARAIAAVTEAGEIPLSDEAFEAYVKKNVEVFADVRAMGGQAAQALDDWLEASGAHLRAVEVGRHLKAAAQRRSTFAF